MYGSPAPPSAAQLPKPQLARVAGHAMVRLARLGLKATRPPQEHNDAHGATSDAEAAAPGPRPGTSTDSIQASSGRSDATPVVPAAERLPSVRGIETTWHV